MLARRYGNKVRSVVPNFDPRAMNEIGFRRTDEWSLPIEEFESNYELVGERSLIAHSEGDVKLEAEAALLEDLLVQIDEVEEGLEEGMVLLVESEPGRDYPRLRDETTVRVVGGIENRLHFNWWVDPPLRLGLYRERDGAKSI